MDVIQQKQPEIENSKDDKSDLAHSTEKKVDSTMQPKGVGVTSPDVGIDGLKRVSRVQYAQGNTEMWDKAALCFVETSSGNKL